MPHGTSGFEPRLGGFEGWSFLLFEIVPDGWHGTGLQQHQRGLEHRIHEVTPHPKLRLIKWWHPVRGGDLSVTLQVTLTV